MRAVDIILKKRDGGRLGPEEISFFVDGVTTGTVPDYQASALLMAILLRGMTDEETASLTAAMVDSGVRLDLSGIAGAKVDKHSTGGVGDKTSLVVAPLAAACGLIVPMMSGRGLGHTGGTLDKLESIPGFRVNLSLDELNAALASTGCAMVGQSAELAPADKKLYALRDVSGTVESIPLITASILSKKVAEGIEGLVLDVKTGRGAFMKTEAEAHALAGSLVSIGKTSGVRTEAVITSMDAPLGCTVGNALEVIESLEVLKGRGPGELVDLSIDLAARMLLIGGVAVDRPDAEHRVRHAIASGRALDRFQSIVESQGGDPRVVDDYARLPTAPGQHHVPADRSGYVTGLDAELIGRASVALGAGRDRVDDPVDPAVGITVVARIGHRVSGGDPVLTLHYRTEARLDAALSLAHSAIHVGDEPPPTRPLILASIE